jgi:prepilin-type N-terminal cleavage/methylation domain-containing protein
MFFPARDTHLQKRCPGGIIFALNIFMIEENKSKRKHAWLLGNSIAGRRKIRYGRIIMGPPREKNILKPRGFTLVELVITMMIITIVAGIAFPAIQKYAVQRRLKAAARDIIGDFANAKARAMSENVDYEIVINGNNTYSIRPAGGAVLETKSPSKFASDIQVSSNYPGGVITFQTRGTSNAGRIELTNAQGSKATITTTITGRSYVDFDFK